MTDSSITIKPLPMLLDTSLIDCIYHFLNDTEIFSVEKGFKDNHNRVCAVMDRLRCSVPWINTHLNVPKGCRAPYQLPVFMMHASIVKSGVESLLKSFGLYNKDADARNQSSRLYFCNPLKESPLSIDDITNITDNDFFQYFRSLVFAHPQGVKDAKGILLPGEVQYCPFVIERNLQYYESEPDDYVGVMIYSTEESRDFKALRVRFSDITSYIKSRYESLSMLIQHLDTKLKKKEQAWKQVVVDESMSEIDQLRFILKELEKRNAEWPMYHTKELLSYLEAPSSCADNHQLINEYIIIVKKRVPELVHAFMRLDYETYCNIVDELIDHDVPDKLHVDYSLRKIFEYLDDSERCGWAKHDLNIVMNAFASKWVKIDFDLMSKEEIELLVTIACFNERKEYETC